MTQVQRLLPDHDVADLAAYEAEGGGRGLEVALRLEPHEVVDLVDLSGLRGRGGAGFPTGRKWRTIVAHASPGEPTPVVVNGAEGEPGTFKDRTLMRRNPFGVVEGAVIAARAVGSTSITIALKASFVREATRIGQAIAEMRAVGWLDGLDVQVAAGPAEYLFGEETGLLEVLEGRPPFPRVTPPWRRGLDDHDDYNSAADADLASEAGTPGAPPALIDNVETLANVPLILAEGPEWFRSIGTPESPGSVICTVTGATLRHGVGEFACGTPMSEVIEAVGGGPRPNRRIAAVLSGVAAPPLAGDLLDTPLTYEAMAAAGSGLGSASFLVVDDSVPLRDVAADVARFLAVESCGQCEPCKRDGLAIAVELSDSRTPDPALLRDRLATVADGARCALAEQQQTAVGGLLALAASTPDGADRGDQDDAGGSDGGDATGDRATTRVADPDERTAGNPSTADLVAIVPLLDIVDDVAVLDMSHRSKSPDWSDGGGLTEQVRWPAQRLADQPVEVLLPPSGR